MVSKSNLGNFDSSTNTNLKVLDKIKPSTSQDSPSALSKFKTIILNVIVIILLLLSLSLTLAGCFVGVATSLSFVLFAFGSAVMGVNFLIVLMKLFYTSTFLLGRRDRLPRVISSDNKHVGRKDGRSVDQNVNPMLYVYDNIENILSASNVHLCGFDSSIKPLSVKQSYLPYVMFELRNDNNCYLYKLNKYPCVKNNKQSFLVNSYQSYIKAKEVIQQSLLSKLVVMDMEHECIVSTKDGLMYDLIKEQKLPEGCQLLNEQNSHLLSKDVIEQLTEFVCRTGASIDWYNIYINPNNLDQVYLLDLTLPQETDLMDQRIDTGLFGDFCHRGLINCLASEDDINYTIAKCIDILNKPNLLDSNIEKVKRRLNSINCYKDLLSRIDMMDFTQTAEQARGNQLINTISSLRLDKYPKKTEIPKTELVRFDIEDGNAYFLYMKDLIRLIDENPEVCLDNGKQFDLSKDVSDYLNENLLKIINHDPSISDYINYLNKTVVYDTKNICLFSLKQYPDLVFKVYTGSRSEANTLANNSYNESIFVKNIVEKEGLDLLIIPPKNLLKLKINNKKYNVIISKVNKLPNQELNLSRLYKANYGDIKQALYQLITLLSKIGIYINSSNTLLIDDDLLMDDKKKLMILDISKRDTISNLIQSVDEKSYGRGILRFLALEETVDDLLIQCEICLRADTFFNYTKEEVLKYFQSVKSKLSFEIFNYYRAEEFLKNSPITKGVNKPLLDHMPFARILDSGALDVSTKPSSDILSNLDYFNKYKAPISMEVAYNDVVAELDRIVGNKKELIADLVLGRTISEDDIEESEVLSAYSQLYSDGLENRQSWLNKIIRALIANGYACKGRHYQDFCI